MELGRRYGNPCYCSILDALYDLAVTCEKTRVWSADFIKRDLWGLTQLLDYTEEKGRFILLKQSSPKDLSCNELAKSEMRTWSFTIGCLRSEKDVNAACSFYDFLNGVQTFQAGKATYFGVMPTLPVISNSNKFGQVRIQARVKIQQRTIPRDQKLVVIP
jgi:hypothetical protein